MSEMVDVKKAEELRAKKKPSGFMRAMEDAIGQASDMEKEGLTEEMQAPTLFVGLLLIEIAILRLRNFLSCNKVSRI